MTYRVKITLNGIAGIGVNFYYILLLSASDYVKKMFKVFLLEWFALVLFYQYNI